MIYKKNIFLTVLFIAYLLICNSCCYSYQQGKIEYDENLFDYSKINSEECFQKAEAYLQKGVQFQDIELRKKYIQKALSLYYLSSKADPQNVNSLIQIGKIYDDQGMDRLAKEYFSRAICTDSKNAQAYQGFGDFYYKRGKYKKALSYYQKSYELGLSNNYQLNTKLALTYDKLADLEMAKYYYMRINSVKSNKYIKNKIIQIEDLNYTNTGYYNSITE